MSRLAALAAAVLGVAPLALGGPDAALFDAPAAGSYELPVIDRVREWSLLDTSGARAPLLDLPAGHAALVAFVYRSCSDAAGCPATLATLQSVDTALAARADLAERVRMVTVSFDPGHDTPARMAELRERIAPRSDWRFFTAASQQELTPVLADFGQDATRLFDASGEPLASIRHVVKVFLVDARGDVRNIYSAGLLSVPLLLADLETVLLPSERAPGAAE